MAISTTTPAAIRAAVKTAVQGMSVDHPEDSDQSWIPSNDYLPSGPRHFAIIQDPSTHRWFTGADATHGGRGTSYTYEMRIRVGYGGLGREEQEDRPMSDHGALWELLHPRTASGAGTIDIDGVMSFMADAAEPGIEEVIGEEDGGPVYDFVFQVHYLRAHNT